MMCESGVAAAQPRRSRAVGASNRPKRKKRKGEGREKEKWMGVKKQIKKQWIEISNCAGRAALIGHKEGKRKEGKRSPPCGVVRSVMPPQGPAGGPPCPGVGAQVVTCPQRRPISNSSLNSGPTSISEPSCATNTAPAHKPSRIRAAWYPERTHT